MPKEDDTFGGEERHSVYVWLGLWGSIIGTICSLLTIVLIVRMKSNTGHLHLVLLMTVYQLLYDVSFCFSDMDFGYYPNCISNLLQLFGGVGSALISNWIGFVAMYIVILRKKFDVFGSIVTIHLSTILPALANSLLYLGSSVPRPQENDFWKKASVVYVYNNIRLASIFFNFVFVLTIASHIYNRSSSNTPQEIAIRTLCLRMIYYPVVQAIGRSGYTWYEFAYGPKPGGVDFDGFPDLQYGVLLFATVIAPAVSVGYLMIFLIMQPNAYHELIALFKCRSISNENEQDNDGKMIVVRNKEETERPASLNTEPITSNGSISTLVSAPGEERLSAMDWARKSYSDTRFSIDDNRHEEELYSIISIQERYTDYSVNLATNRTSAYWSTRPSIQASNRIRGGAPQSPTTLDSSVPSTAANSPYVHYNKFLRPIPGNDPSVVETENILHSQARRRGISITDDL
jgi:hypothetical protein